MGHYVYKYVLNDEIIYIGKCDGNIDNRLYQHGKAGDNIDADAWDDIKHAQIYITKLANSTMSDVVESELIRRYKPKYNKAKLSSWSGLLFVEPSWERYKRTKKKRIPPKVVNDSDLTREQFEKKYKYSKHNLESVTGFECPKHLFILDQKDLNSYFGDADRLWECLQLLHYKNNKDGHIAKESNCAIVFHCPYHRSGFFTIVLQHGDEEMVDQLSPIIKAQAYADSVMINAAQLMTDISPEEMDAYEYAKRLAEYASGYSFITQDDLDKYEDIYDKYREKRYEAGIPSINKSFGFNGKDAYVLTDWSSDPVRKIVSEKIEDWMLDKRLWSENINKPGSKDNCWVYREIPFSDIVVSIGSTRMHFSSSEEGFI